MMQKRPLLNDVSKFMELTEDSTNGFRCRHDWNSVHRESWLSGTMQVEAYYVANVLSSCSTGWPALPSWMSGAFCRNGRGIYFGGHESEPRKFGCYTVPDFIGTRYGGNLARLLGVIVLVVASFTYVTAQINATGTIPFALS